MIFFFSLKDHRHWPPQLELVATASGSAFATESAFWGKG
jgi:hypothetical protein